MGGPALVEEKLIEELDNFYICYFTEIEDGNKLEYSSTEHYYQSHKMLKPESRTITREARTANEAYLFGNMFPLRKGWEEMKNEVMFNANLLKFQQNENLKKILLSTNQSLIEFPYSDSYWGTQPKKSGEKGDNISGLILMAIRAYLKEDLDTYSRYRFQLNLK